ncbi:MAG: asparagine synthase (glutamine-hydrolyzing) [Lentisphaerae bacterium]|nr:asparagine synthase (glutamine-hydrolyzing) [Lentisphaerota bacterium]
MCGFLQVIHRNKPVNRDRFRHALASMRHRGPDQSGELFVERETCAHEGQKQTVYFAFGHQRLSILDVSEKSRQPFVIGPDVLLFNGEIYNFKELNEALIARGHVIETHGDTETLFKSVLAQEDQALKHFNGMWAFSLYQADRFRLFLSRDRYGKKPLFYYRDTDTFCVSSTLYAIQSYLHRPLVFNRDTVARYLVHGTLYPSGCAETHYQGISQILPGHWGVFDLNSWTIRQERYFNFYDSELAGQINDDPEQLVEDLKDSVRKRLISDRPVGLLLSGGIDSTLILSTLYTLGLHEHCRVYMGDTGKSEDYAYAKRCADQLGVRAETVLLDYDSNTFDRFLTICRHQEKPFSMNGSTMAMPQMYEVIAAQGVPVVLDGTGGDELFGGYWQRQFPFAVREAVRQGDWTWIWNQLLCKDDEHIVRTHLLRSFLPAAWLEATQSAGNKLKALAYPCLKVELRQILGSSTADPLDNLSFSFTEAMCADLAPGGRLGEWLWHNDRNSMMSSVEGRSPLLDYRLNRYAYSGYRRKFRSAWNKYELRQAFDSLAPLPSQWRQQKQGFRWDGKRFLYNNQSRILELLRANTCLTDLVDMPKLVSYAHRYPKLLRSSFLKKALVISGVEAALGGV